MTDHSPIELLKQSIRFWWIPLVLAALGGGAGWIFSKLTPPVYEATANFNVSLDEQQLVNDGLITQDKLPLDFGLQNDYLSPLADMFFAKDLRTRFITDVQSQGINLQGNDFTSAAYNLDRQGFSWFITVRSTNPGTAARLANLWLADTNALLLEAKAHTARSLALGLQRDSVSKCFSELDFAKANQCAGTTFSSPADLDVYLNNLQQMIASEQQAGRGIYPAVRFVISGSAQSPSSPILYAASLMILAGCLIGLLAGVMLVGYLPARDRRK